MQHDQSGVAAVAHCETRTDCPISRRRGEYRSAQLWRRGEGTTARRYGTGLYRLGVILAW